MRRKCQLCRSIALEWDPGLECAPDGGHLAGWRLTGTAGLSEDESHALSTVRMQIARGRDVARSCEARRHAPRNPGVKKLEIGGFDEDAQAADLLQEYEARIAALERMVGRQALEIEFLKGALKNAPRPRSAITSVITGPWHLPCRRMPSDGPAAL